MLVGALLPLGGPEGVKLGVLLVLVRPNDDNNSPESQCLHSDKCHDFSMTLGVSHQGFTAIHSISTNAPRGRPFAAMVLRAGGVSVTSPKMPS